MDWSPNENPLADHGVGADAPWNDLMEAVGPASLLVVIRSRLGPILTSRYAPEDVLQEALVRAWRGRASLEWRGLKPFRAWLLGVIDNTIRDLADLENTQKRGGGAAVQPLAPPTRDGWRPSAWEPARSTTPSRVAEHRESADAMLRALGSIDPELATIVRLRLHEELPVEAIGRMLGMDEAAVRRRFRKGLEAYERALSGSSSAR
jgi:RNA polymerase sigma factor (sigma-70 family)